MNNSLCLIQRIEADCNPQFMLCQDLIFPATSTQITRRILHVYTDTSFLHTAYTNNLHNSPVT